MGNLERGSISSLIARVDLLDLDAETESALVDDAIDHQEAILGGLRVMGEMFKSHASQARYRNTTPDEISCDDLEQLGRYFISSADLLSGLSCAISELSATAAVRRIKGE